FVEDKAAEIAQSMGAVSDFRLLLMTAISLADQLDETRDMADGKDPRDRAAHMEKTLVNALKRIEDITREAEANGQADF
ncbi:MAG: cell division protein ZapA, partial [Alphaproteobacteria bacterium]|nr:cell division protein ZapA [Alphaproteobacteria bacterium]